MKPVLRIGLQALIVVSSVLLVGALALLLIPGLSLLAAVTAPMSPYCSTWRSVRDASTTDPGRLERVDFIKADIKGATERMLRGGTGTIGRFHPRMALATDSPPEDPQAMAQWLGTLGNYQAVGGPCFYNEGEIRTDVMFFR